MGAVSIGLLLAGCGQASTPTTQATLAGPELAQATFTVTPPAVTPTPSPTPPRPSANPTEAGPANAEESAALTPTARPTETAAATLSVTPAETSTAEGGAEGEGGCIDKAAFYDDVTIPDGSSFKQSVPFTKTWQIRNVGTCTWDGYKLVYAGGDIMDGALENPMPLVRPGEIANISVELKSPPQGGAYTGLWEFANAAGQRFGVNSHGQDLIWVKIGVSWYTEEYPPGQPKPTPSGAPAASCTVTQNADYEAQILTLINQARAQNGLAALTLREPLSAAARSHSQDMACNDFVDHTGSDGSSWYVRIQAQQYSYSYASENIYVGSPEFGGDAKGAFEWWMNSDVHRANILSPKVTSLGIGYAYYADSTYQGYYTVDFARP